MSARFEDRSGKTLTGLTAADFNNTVASPAVGGPDRAEIVSATR